VKMGIIAEDDSDVRVVSELTLTLLKPHKIGFKRFVGNGCGKLRRKCGVWAQNLVAQGCLWVAVIHDLDANNVNTLRADLSRALAPSRARATVILIPKHEIEAWLLYDKQAIARAFKQSQTPNLPGDPESLPHPKEFLRDLIRRKYDRDYLNTVHNALIAKQIVASSLRRSQSFAPHFEFTSTIRETLSTR
jgi:hypothetical protein